MSEEVKEETKEEVNDSIEPSIIAQFVFHPQTGEILLEVAENIDLMDIVRCRRALDEQIEDAHLNLLSNLFQGQQKSLTQVNALMQGMRQLLKKSLEDVSVAAKTPMKVKTISKKEKE